MTAAAANPAGFVDDAARELAAVSPAELSDWRVTRGRLHEELLAVPDGRKLACLATDERGRRWQQRG